MKTALLSIAIITGIAACRQEVASPQGQMTLYEADKATWSGGLLLTQPHPSEVRYLVFVSPPVDYTTQKTLFRPVSFYFPQDGYFRI